MISINGIQVDITTSTDSLSSKWAVFVVEFEFDNRLIVCHTFNQSVHKGIKNLINRILRNNTKNIELRYALLNSKYITINIEKCGPPDKLALLAYKYNLIKMNKTYQPYGYNTLIKAGNTLEQGYADTLLQELINEIDKTAMYPCKNIKSPSKKGRAPKPVYNYDKKTGNLIAEWPSIKSAAEGTGIYASNITMCCNDRIKTAGGYMWSYKKNNNHKLLYSEDLY